MLRDSIAKYYFFKFKNLLFNTKFVDNPFKTTFNIKIKETNIKGHIDKLIDFAESNYSPKMLDVKNIHKIVNWKEFYKNLSNSEKREFENLHMWLVLRANLSYPIIVTSNDKGEISNILDGLHRIKKSYMLGIETIKAYIIPEIDLLTFKTKYYEEF